MAKKLVEAITSMEDDFAQWYTDVVKKAELCGYTSVKGCMAIKPAGYEIWENIKHDLDRRFKETGVQKCLPNGVPVLVSLCLDITGQMEAQAELESIVQCPMGGIFRARMDRDFTLIYANDHYYALHGLTREDLRNKFGNKTIHLVHPEDIPWMEQRLQKAIEQKEQTVSLEYRVVRPDGRTVWLMVNGSLSEQRGNTLLTGMVIDISHQKSMEERLCCKSWYQRTLCVENNGPIS